MKDKILKNDQDTQSTQTIPATQSTQPPSSLTAVHSSSLFSGTQTNTQSTQPETQPETLSEALPQTATQAADFVPVVRFPDFSSTLPPTLLVNTPLTESPSSGSSDSQPEMPRP